MNIMLKIELVPSLSDCIHAMTKKEYEDALSQLLSGEYGSKNLEEKFRLLNILLKEMDFKQLRQESERYLVEGKNVKFIFYLKKGIPKYEMQVKESKGE
jgi:hypothetical protein